MCRQPWAALHNAFNVEKPMPVGLDQKPDKMDSLRTSATLPVNPKFGVLQ
jgi:hypothetical protein